MKLFSIVIVKTDVRILTTWCDKFFNFNFIDLFSAACRLSRFRCVRWESTYKFLKFERVINKKRKEYRDASTKENIDKLNQELVDVKNIMSESFEMLLNRDKNLNKLTELGKSLSEDSARMKKDAKNLKMAYFLRKYMTYLVVAAILLFLLIMKVYVFWY